MYNAMRSSKRLLAGLAAGALTVALVPMVASSAQAATSSVTLGFPSMTVIQDATIKPAIPVTYKVDGLNAGLTGITLVPTIVDKDGVSVLGTTASTFFSDDTALNTQTAPNSGISAFNLQNGQQNAVFTSIPAGTYTLSVTAVSQSTGVAVATSSMPFAVVTTAAAGGISGAVSFVSAQSLTATAVTSATVATGSAVSAATPVYAAFLNAAGGPIVGAGALFTAAAATTSATTTSLGAGTAAAAAPGIYSFTYGGGDTWSASPGAGSIRAYFASPVNQLVGTLPVTLSASATMTDLAITSAVEGTASAGSTADDSTAVPAVNGVKFKVSGITKVSSVATAGVPVTFTVAGRNQVDGANATAFSAISPATATTVTSGAGGTVDLEYTVSNPVNNTGARVTATYPGGSKTFYIQFQTPVVSAVEVASTTVSASNSGNLTLGAVVVDQFGEPVKSLPVQAAVTGVGATTTPASLTTNASGEVSYTIAVPAGTVAGATSALTFTSWNGSAFSGPANTINITYVAGSAAVANLAVKGAFAANAGSYTALTAGKLNSATTPLYVNTQVDVTAPYTPAADGYAWKIQATATNATGAAVAGAPIVITPASGGYVQNPATGRWATSATVYSDASGLATAVLAATKTGDISYSVTSGAASATVSAVYDNRPTDARYVAIASSASTVKAGDGATITATVTDRFGNPVRGVLVTFSEEGPGYIAGSGQAVSSAAGRTEATLVTVAGLNGVSRVTADVAATQSVSMPQALPSATAQTYATLVGATLQTGNLVDKVSSYNAWPPVNATTATVLGVTAGNTAAAVPVEVSAAGGKTISITGSRTTVSGKPGIRIDGVVTGIDNGKTVIPYFRFPGETTFAQGTARPVIEQSGFTWQRKTGKKFYAYVTSDDGAVTSNRVIIAAN